MELLTGNILKDAPVKNIWTGAYNQKGEKIYEDVQGYKELLFFKEVNYNG
ncbi:MAG: hypothetical protein IPJ45_13735 [Ignavibacteria bacterium]|nr:hypothetical protein [Ignavibacteria bacterium]